MRRVLDTYRRALLIHFAPDAEIRVAELERTFFLRGAVKAWGLGAGPCRLCPTCPVESGSCRYPERARPSMEACGIDVFTTAHNAGFPLEVVRSRQEQPNYYGLVLVD